MAAGAEVGAQSPPAPGGSPGAAAPAAAPPEPSESHQHDGELLASRTASRLSEYSDLELGVEGTSMFDVSESSQSRCRMEESASTAADVVDGPSASGADIGGTSISGAVIGRTSNSGAAITRTSTSGAGFGARSTSGTGFGRRSTSRSGFRRSSTFGTENSAATSSSVHLGEKIRAFDAERVEDRKRKFHAVVWVFKRVLLVGVLVDVAGIACRRLLGDHISAILVAIGLALITCALVIGSACPMDLLDFDTLCEKIPKTTSGTWVALALLALLQVRFFPHLDAVKALINLGAATTPWRRCLPTWWPMFSTLVGCYLIFDPISWGFIFIFHERNDFLQMQRLPSVAIGSFNLLAGVTSGAIWLWRQWQIRHGTHGEGIGVCGACYEAFYWYAGTVGVRFILVGASWMALPRPGFADVVGGAIELAKGVSIFAPVVLAVVLGRYRLFLILGRHFDRDGSRRRRDGAFVAELLESVQMQVGQSWWVHRESPDERYQNFDPRRNWQEGKVVEVLQAEGDFVVELPSSRGAPSLGTDPGTRGPSSGARRVRQRLPSSGEGTTDDFLLRVKNELRCVEFERMTPELMARVDARSNPELQATWYGLSRPVRDGERVDYFLSNSWYDEPVAKWEKLSKVATSFHRRHGRYPTFWLDKLCISQSAITDGLRCLPVNVMACNKLLALCGDTYLSRLWCIWELFTLFAFMSEESAMERVEFVFLGDQEKGLRMLDSMASFHVRDSHCYDPNEEARLLEVIAAVGTTRFNRRIANMARKTRLQLSKQPRRCSKEALSRTFPKVLSRGASSSKTSTPSTNSGGVAATP